MGNRWGNSGNSVRLYFGGSKITADGDCSHEIKRRLLLGRKIIINLDSIFKSRDITLSTKVHLVKAIVFPVVMYWCESWTVKKAERRRIDTSELWCWKRLLRVPWTARRFNQSVLKEISPGISLEGLMLNLKLQYFGYLMWRVDPLEKTDAGRDWGQEEKWTTEDEMASPTRWTWVWVNSRSWWWTGRPGVLQFMGSQRVEYDWATALNSTELREVSCIGEGNGNPLQCSCLENPRDGGAWWAAVYGVAQSQTGLKWHSSSRGFLQVPLLRFPDREGGNLKDTLKVKVKSFSCVRLFATPWTVTHQAPPSMGFSKQEYWSGLPFPSPGDLPHPGIEPRSPSFQADALTSEPPGKPTLL